MSRWRSALFMPANRPELVAKAPRSGPDLVILDLEDAVPAEQKDRARAELGGSVASLQEAGIPAAVRINPIGTPWFEDDLAALPDGLAAVAVPMLDTAEALDAARAGGVPVMVGVETVLGVSSARELLTDDLAGCYFGAEDYIVDLGGVRTDSNDEVAVPRALVAMAARLAGIPALDMVTSDFGDDDRFRSEAASARALGYAGKLCIHPAQVALAKEAFSPSADEVDRARRLLAAYDAAVAEGRASINFEGEMADEVHAKRARAILAQSEE